MKSIFGALLLFAISNSTLAKTETCPLPKGKVSISANDIKIEDLLKFILSEAKIDLELVAHPLLQRTVSLNTKDAELCELFEFAMAEGNLTYFADVAGVWNGRLSLDGSRCKATPIEIKISKNVLSITAVSDQHRIDCSNRDGYSYFGLEEEYQVRGSELWKYGAHMGGFSKTNISIRDRLCNIKGECEYWDFIKIDQVDENTIQVWVSTYRGEWTLSGELTR